ncbi:MAG: DUF928 domain-containing protein [Microcoleaceae cyanobacterium]
MRWKTLCLQPIGLNLLLTALLTQSGMALEPILAKSDNYSELSSQTLNYEPYKPPAEGAPNDRGDAGSRSPFDFMVLVPRENIGATATDYPTFWLYVKTAVEKPISIELELRDGQDNTIYRTQFELNQGPGIVSVPVPQDSPALKAGEKYYWYFSSFEYELYRFGELQRIALSPKVERQLANLTPKERIAVLANKGLWYETMTELAELRRINPEDDELAAAWAELLADPDVALEKIVSQPVLNCCTSTAQSRSQGLSQ